MFFLLFLKPRGEDRNRFTDVNKNIAALYSSTLISPAVNAGNQNSLSLRLSLWTCLWSPCFVNEVICLSNYILPPLRRCDIQINTFPLVFVHLTLFFFPVFKASRSSSQDPPPAPPPVLALCPLIFSPTALCSYFLLFLLFCQPVVCQQVPLCSGQKSPMKKD